ncbi:MAG: hypothetical protein ACTSSP_04045 [Candidatus Asgardarchaeia archaeon]
MPEEKKETGVRVDAETLVFRLLLIGGIAFLFAPSPMDIMILQFVLGGVMGISLIMFIKTSYYTLKMRERKED